MDSLTIDIISNSLEETHQIGRSLGSAIVARTLIALRGDLGSGKTAFVQGLAQGLDVPDHYYIVSPTFTLVNDYPGRLRLFHVDVYRLSGATDLNDLGLDEIMAEDGVVAIEWAEKLPDGLWGDHIVIDLIIVNDVSRQLRICAVGKEMISFCRSLQGSYEKE